MKIIIIFETLPKILISFLYLPRLDNKNKDSKDANDSKRHYKSKITPMPKPGTKGNQRKMTIN